MKRDQTLAGESVVHIVGSRSGTAPWEVSLLLPPARGSPILAMPYQPPTKTSLQVRKACAFDPIDHYILSRTFWVYVQPSTKRALPHDDSLSLLPMLRP